MSKRSRKRKLEIDNHNNALHDLSSDDDSRNHNHNSPPKKRVKFDQSVNADSSNDKYHKYEASSIHFPKVSDFLKVRVGDNPNVRDLCQASDSDSDNDSNTSNRNRPNNKQLWLFHFPPGFDESLINNLKISIPQHAKSGQIIATFPINKQRYQIIEHDCSQKNFVNLFPVRHKLRVGQPFKRHFHILPDLRPSPHKRNRNKYMEAMNLKPVPCRDGELWGTEDNITDTQAANEEEVTADDNAEDHTIDTNDVQPIEPTHDINEEEIEVEQVKKRKKKKKRKKAKKELIEAVINEDHETIEIQTETHENTKKRKSKKDKKKKKKHKRKSAEVSPKKSKKKSKKSKKKKKSKKLR
eukprot:124386_1